MIHKPLSAYVLVKQNLRHKGQLGNPHRLFSDFIIVKLLQSFLAFRSKYMSLVFVMYTFH